MKRNILIGGAWPYANNSLHIGHLAALLPGDVIARYYRLNGDNVVYVSGTDCHGTPITVRAKSEDTTPNDIATHYDLEFRKSFESLDFSYDLYSATMRDSHKEKVKQYFTKIMDNGYIYEEFIDQDYCPNCNEFLSDREIIGTCPNCGGHATGEQCDECLSIIDCKTLKDKHCKNCNEKTIIKKNKHLYFKLSSFQKVLEDLVRSKEGIWRKNALNETKKYLNLGVIDRAATRQLTWGVDVPVSGYEDKKIYVWIEAVLGYMTACEEVLNKRKIDFKSFVTDKENFKSYFVHGKDNITFHTIIFPALLSAIDKDFILPSYIISSEYVNMNDEKMSKSKGNLITFDSLVKDYGSDTVRMYMINNGPEKKDVNFSSLDLINYNNKFLVGVIGNFINRNLSFVNKKFDGIIKEGNIDNSVKEKTISLYEDVASLIEAGELKTALEQILDYAAFGNKYYDANEPWIKVKEDINKFNDITYTCTYIIANLSRLLYPFMPRGCNKIKNMLSLDDFIWKEYDLKGDAKIKDLELLFNRID